MYGNRFIQAVITPFCYVLVAILYLYQYGEDIFKGEKHGR